MPQEPDLHDFLRPDEITPEYLDGMIDETEPRQDRILEYFELDQHESADIPVKVYIHQQDRHASITGFADRYIRMRGHKHEEMRVSPFHVKNARSHKVDHNGLEIDADGNPMLADWAVADAVNYMETARRNLQVWAALSMLNEKQFVYSDGERTLDIPFDQQIVDGQAPSNEFDDSSFSANYEYRLMKQRYYRKTGQVPDLMFISGTTAATVTEANGIKENIVPLQPSDPERGEETYDVFMFAGITHVVLHAMYPSRGADGTVTLKEPIDEGYGILTVSGIDEEGGRSPFRFHRASTKLNNRDPSRPFYRAFVEDEETRAIAVALDDNFIPGVAKREIAQKIELYT